MSPPETRPGRGAEGLRRAVLRTLFVRPPSERPLSPSLRFEIPREPKGTLPLGLIRIASAVKFCSPHRVTLHDARCASPVGTSSVRSAAAIHRPDVSVVWLHPASLPEGLESARAVRQAGCPLVIGAGPLIDLWPEGARRIPELDGLIPSAAMGALVRALDTIASGSRAQNLAAALAGGEGGGAEVEIAPIDRKLVDYAAYTLVPAGGWPPPRRPAARLFARVRGQVPVPEGAASVVPLHRVDGTPLAPAAILDDMRGCDLLGISWQDLAPLAGGAPLSEAWWSTLLDALRDSVRSTGTRRWIRLGLTPRAARGLPLVDLRSLGVVAVDLGDIHVGDLTAVEEALGAAKACRRAGLDPGAALLVGLPGTRIGDEETGLSRLFGAGLRSSVRAVVRLGAGGDAAWSDWLDAPSEAFVPPGIDPERLQLIARLGSSSSRQILDGQPISLVRRVAQRLVGARPPR